MGSPRRCDGATPAWIESPPAAPNGPLRRFLAPHGAVSGRPPHGLARRLVGTLVNQRASFEFVVTEACLRKVVGRAALARSIERRRHQATARRTHYQQQRRTLH